MERFSAKIEIINHFDNLINNIDIDIDNCLEKYNDEKILGELLVNSENNRKNFRNKNDEFYVEFYPTFNSSQYQYQSLDLWTQSTKVIEYLKQIRMKTIEELRYAQEETLEYYKLNSSRFKSALSKAKNLDELKSTLFTETENFFFQLNFTQSDKRLWAFNVFTFVTDFYISPSQIDSLEKLINAEKQPFDRDCVFDEKMVLIGLIYKFFIENLLNFPNHVIRVCKQDVSNIASIIFEYEFSGADLTSSSTIDLSNLVQLSLNKFDSEDKRESVRINIEGLPSLESLHLGVNSTEIYFSIRNLSSLKYLGLLASYTIDQDIIIQLLHQVQHIERLHLHARFSYFSLDNFKNLKFISLIGTINESFNYELFKNLCDQLKDLSITLINIDEKKLLYGHRFSNLQNFGIRNCKMKKLKKEFTDSFPMLRKLFILDCDLEEIENDAFTNLKQLICLDLSRNRLKFIEKNTLSNLNNLEILDLSKNELTNLEAEFIGVKNSVEIFLQNKGFLTISRHWIGI